MNRGLEVIQKRHVNEAIDKINKSNFDHWPCIVWELRHGEKTYSPKQVITHAFEIATNRKIDQVYDITDCLEILRKYEFVVNQKNTPWKLGCNWGSGTPSFYEYVKDANIVIGTSKLGLYEIGDLILVTEGFTVNALAEIKSNPTRLKENSVHNMMLGEYEVEDFGDVFYYDVDFYELNKLEIFTYELQQGIVRVRNNEVLNGAINIWENRNKLNKYYGFHVGTRSEIRIDYSMSFPCLILSQDNWDDYNFKTTHHLRYHRDPSNYTKIGSLKILQRNQKRTEIPSSFEQLTYEFCSLGVEPDYYENLKILFPNNFEGILDQLRDVAKNQDIREEFETLEGFQSSILRPTQAYYVLENYHDIVGLHRTDLDHNFAFQVRVGEAIEDHRVKFEFGGSEDLINRFFLIVGKNASGKTKFISRLANKLANNKEEGEFTEGQPTFSKVIAASFSFFDKFRFPDRGDTSYQFIGIKNKTGLIDEHEYSGMIWKSFKNIAIDKEKKKLWDKSIKSSLETNYLDFDLEELQNVSTEKQFIEKTENIFSSGQNIIFQFITRFIESVEKNSVLIFDEPETHLHPNIAGRLLRTLHSILEEYKSYCIMATHSPIILQEIPSKFIRVFDRQENAPVIYTPTIECLGENLSEINNVIFKVEEETELYKKQFDELVDKGYSYEEILELIGGGLSLNARIYILGKIDRKNA